MSCVSESVNSICLPVRSMNNIDNITWGINGIFTAILTGFYKGLSHLFQLAQIMNIVVYQPITVSGCF